MGIVSWIVMGLTVGVLAKWIMPGKDPGGLIGTILIGIAAAFVGGFVGSLFGVGRVSGFNLLSIVLAVGGALLLLAAYRMIKKQLPESGCISIDPQLLLAGFRRLMITCVFLLKVLSDNLLLNCPPRFRVTFQQLYSSKTCRRWSMVDQSPSVNV